MGVISSSIGSGSVMYKCENDYDLTDDDVSYEDKVNFCQNRRTPFVSACERGNKKNAMKLIKSKYYDSHTNKNQTSDMYTASQYGFEDIAIELLKIKDIGLNPIFNYSKYTEGDEDNDEYNKLLIKACDKRHERLAFELIRNYKNKLNFKYCNTSLYSDLKTVSNCYKKT